VTSPGRSRSGVRVECSLL